MKGKFRGWCSKKNERMSAIMWKMMIGSNQLGAGPRDCQLVRAVSWNTFWVQAYTCTVYIYIYCAYDFICVYVRIYIHLFTVCNVHVYVHRYVSLPIFTLGHSVYILNIHFTWHSLSFWDERKTAGILLQKLGPQSCCSLSHPAESSQYPPTKNSGKWRSIS